VEIKCQQDATEFFIADLIACSTCFGAPLCPSSGAQEYYTVVAACGISCCKNVKNNFVSFHILTTMHGQNHIKFENLTLSKP